MKDLLTVHFLPKIILTEAMYIFLKEITLKQMVNLFVLKHLTRKLQVYSWQEINMHHVKRKKLQTLFYPSIDINKSCVRRE